MSRNRALLLVAFVVGAGWITAIVLTNWPLWVYALVGAVIGGIVMNLPVTD